MIRVLILGVTFLFLGACQQGGTRPQQHIAPDPKAAEINMRLGLNYMQRGDYAVALEKLEKSLKQDPNLPSTHNTIALLYQRLGMLDTAEKHFKESISRAPNYSEAHNNYGVFLCQQKQYDESEKQFLLAIKNPLYNSAAQAIENAGLCVSRIPDLVRAEAHFHKALQINPNMAKSLLNLADISYQQHDYTQAKSYMKRYQSVSLWSPQALLIMIKIEKKLGEKNEVASHLLLLKGKFPDSDQAQQVRRGEY
ncbi:MAG: type IV pilus biogenesis/stability protein PilW [Piscirickettsiaceae bacterium]|nr:type IV pilus biogenesis/stability protein PilW [Piscirickettsiaceae bacterium]